MTGRVQETGQEVYIKFIDYDINTAVYSKADLLKAVQHQLSSSRFTRQFQVVDFDKDARVTNRYGDLYIAGTDGSVNLGKDEVQQYLLSGHVILKKLKKKLTLKWLSLLQMSQFTIMSTLNLMKTEENTIILLT
ncbi:streptokinase [Streptococcus dysgalactiae subsp. equisimilis 167]|nr:streptokinase [Streptococcus dysgalactiae subsp. equisimilis 167]